MKNKKIIFIIIIMILVLGVVVACLSTNLFSKNNNKENDINENKKEEFSYTPILYKICDEDSCMHLLGSMHMGDSKITKFNDVVLDIYNNSNYLAVEVDTTDAVIDESLFILDGETLDDIIDDDLNKKLEDFSSKHILFPYEQFKMFTLGYIYDYLSVLTYMEIGYLNEGVDAYFLKLAHKENKKIISLETLESQLAFFTDYSDEFYMNQIEYTIDNYDEQKDLSKELYKVYLTGNVDDLEKLLSEEDIDLTLEEEKYNQAMIYDRNINMSEKLEEFLKDNKNVFMIVGAAHVVGDGGIIDLIDEKTYKINIVK